MLMFDEWLDFDLVNQSLYEFRIDFGQRNLLYCYDEFRNIMLSSIDVTETPFP